MIGVVPLAEARKRAEDEALDLVLISPQPDNPVCKIMDYGRYVFEQGKREREARRNQHVTEVKEIGLRLTIEAHDMEVKTRNAIRFLEDGDRVKVMVKFRGREMAYQSRGADLLRGFAETVRSVGTVEREPKTEGRNMIMFLAPRKN